MVVKGTQVRWREEAFQEICSEEDGNRTAVQRRLGKLRLGEPCRLIHVAVDHKICRARRRELEGTA